MTDNKNVSDMSMALLAGISGPHAVEVHNRMMLERRICKMEDTIEKVLQKEAYAQEWQPIETAPEYDEVILALKGNTMVFLGARYKNQGWFCHNCDLEKYPPTHWMPLPKSPHA